MSSVPLKEKPSGSPELDYVEWLDAEERRREFVNGLSSGSGTIHAAVLGAEGDLANAHIAAAAVDDNSVGMALVTAIAGTEEKHIIREDGVSSFLQLVSAAKRKIAFGKTKIEKAGAEEQGWYANVTHGLGTTPAVVVAIDATGTFQRIVSADQYGATTFRAGVYRSDGAKSKTAEIAWVAIG